MTGLLLFAPNVLLFAAPEIAVTIPSVRFTTDDELFDSKLNTLFTTDPAVIAVHMAIEKAINGSLSQFGSQELLGKGFANANAYSSQSATLQGYQGYKLLAVMGGLMVGVQLPSFDLAILEAIPATIAEKPDVYAGIAPSMSFNVGLNAGSILGGFNEYLGYILKPFYVNIKFAALDQNTPIKSFGDVDMSSKNFGVGVNYQWKPQTKSILLGLFKWRGVNIGSGLNYQSTVVQFSTNLQKIEQPFSVTIPITVNETETTVPVSATFTVSPKVNLGIDMFTVSIPLEVSTSIQFLWLLNLNIGAGGDLIFGKTTITANANSSFSIEALSINNVELNSNEYTITPGRVSLDAGTTDIPPSLARMRLMAGIGAQVGPLKIDVPVYYYLNSGLAAGLSCGFVW